MRRQRRPARGEFGRLGEGKRKGAVPPERLKRNRARDGAQRCERQNPIRATRLFQCGVVVSKTIESPA